jgi:hypothetical protein
VKNPVADIFRVPKITGSTTVGEFTVHELDHGLRDAGKDLFDALTAPLPKREGGAA